MKRSWEEVSARAGRNRLPGLLFESYYIEGDLDPDDLGKAIAHAWVSAEWPEQHADVEIWAATFENAGFLSDDPEDDADGPANPPEVLYRGAVEDRALGMSWTDDLEQARWFATRFLGMSSEPGVVYALRPHHSELLAHFTRRGENEWVVDTRDIEFDQLEVVEEHLAPAKSA